MIFFGSINLNHGDSKCTWTSKSFANSREQDPITTKGGRETYSFYLLSMDRQGARP